ncbi:MAG: Asp-tRNA(Asn)/Glu-tRNA(Gln) amidotransferase GatCAB subunit C [Candidatus Magasanikbacteria bacterium CG10_big_fil_rev_8_21_14_0_10_43_6]|uniref:Aspartyl/glutamyl-tRNA(Asn/Gln) amidotransferase subunit C n=1 Tax=Candidatus Magasanikbacteria bacterium CG10_big_fil_rev_8_21_14_0_10_43_6 TaxID=1974650 RepID=A0A2M6W183_9BACT|nr:MAG: Asp-tRNA(Asn)/Glu-tRNA(Gln) amidotransferase GatCAB subunit C [Candidatus Magasanikbacteria bacterium CG10_big_fil_rev_8_21_14_0_10_43_6]
MKVSVQEVENIAELAHLSLTAEETKQYAEQLSVILEYISMLNEVDTEGVEETCQVTGLMNVTREDEVAACDPEMREKLIAAFPDKVGNLLKVRGVFQTY